MRKLCVWTTGVLTFLASGLAFSQQQAAQEPLPTSVLGPQLVAWSQVQQPHPTPAPLPQNQSENNVLPVEQQQPGPPTHSVTASSAKDGERHPSAGSTSAISAIDNEGKSNGSAKDR
jgi:hypothetical protein